MEKNPDTIIIWGLHPVEEALLRAPSAVKAVYHLPSFGKKKAQKRLLGLVRRAGLRASRLPDFHAFAIPSGAVHQGVAAVVKPIWDRDLSWLLSRIRQKMEAGAVAGDRAPLVVVLDRLEDPQNLGAAIRSSTAFRADAVVIPSRRGSPVTGAVVKASAGTIFSARVCRVGNLVRALEAMIDAGLMAAALEGGSSMAVSDADLRPALALVTGAEGRGIRKGVSALCRISVRIPISRQVESLNASAALAVALYEVNRQRALHL